jgi:class 3 adenylate cyclase
MSQTRRLAAILAADVAGYSRLMGADEEGTLEHFKALRRVLFYLCTAGASSSDRERPMPREQ